LGRPTGSAAGFLRLIVTTAPFPVIFRETMPHSLLQPGRPHVNMYSSDGRPFAELYFEKRAEAQETGTLGATIPEQNTNPINNETKP